MVEHVALVGRTSELQRVGEALASARSGRAARLFLVGGAGSGKTSVLEEAARAAEDMLTLRATPVPAEAALAYATLFDLCQPLLHLVDELPGGQADQLAGALNLRPTASTPMGVGASLLSLITRAALEKPVVVLVDDVELVDTESLEALLFAARRVRSDAVAVLLAGDATVRERVARSQFDVVPIGPLDPEAATELLECACPVPPAPAVRAELLHLAQGNPRALTLLPSSLRPAQLRGREPLPYPLPASDDLPVVVAKHLEGLSGDDLLALLTVAASLTGSRPSIEAALAGVGIPANVLDRLISNGLLIDGGRLQFVQPLLRSVVYAQAAADDRRRVHRALGEVLGGEHRLEQRARHLAAAASGYDADAADLLEQAAESLLDRGAVATAASAIDRSVDLTADAAIRARRRVVAAEALLNIGSTEQAMRHLDEIPKESGAPELAATALQLRGRALVRQGKGKLGESTLLDGARLAAGHDPDLAAAMLGEAAMVAVNGRRIDTALALGQQAFGMTGIAPNTRELVGLVLGAVLVGSGDTANGRALLRNDALALRGEGAIGKSAPIVDAVALALVWAESYDEATAVLDKVIAERRGAMALGLLPPALLTRALLGYRTGQPVQAYADAVEALRLLEGDESDPELGTALAILASVEAVLGRRDECLRHVHGCLESLGETGPASAARLGAMSSAAVLELSCGNPEQALEWFALLRHSAGEAGRGNPALVMWEADFVEALVAVGNHTDARRVLDDFSERAHRAGNQRALGAAARCQGLLGDGSAMARWFHQSLAHYETPHHPFGAARTELVWGEALLHGGRLDQAVPHLETALAGFDATWAGAWAERAVAALAQAGAAPRTRRQWPIRTLPAEAAEVALLVAAGFDTPKVASHVLLSEQTVRTLLDQATSAWGERPGPELLRRHGSSDAPSGSRPVIVDTIDLTDPAEAPAGPADIQVLGAFAVSRSGTDISPPPGLGAKLVKMLAVLGSRGGAAIDEVLEMLWPDLDPERGRARLRNVLNRLRTTTGGLVTREGDTLRLAVGTNVDLHRFEELARSALVAAQRGDEGAPGAARAALATHHGVLLPDSPYEPWAAAPRERARRRMLELLDVLIADHRANGRIDDAVRLLETGIEHDPYDEERYALAARLRMEQGRHGAALVLLRRAREVVLDLGVEPSPSLIDLEAALRPSPRR